MQRSACGTDKGKLRKINEDSMLCIEPLNFYMLADGVGGHNSGEVASKLAVDLTEAYLLSESPDSIKDPDIPEYFHRCLEYVNEEIYGRATKIKENAGMATTAVMLLLRPGKAYIVNVGDSRAYLYRKKQLIRITEDHTYVNELLKQGSISMAEAEAHPKKNMITRALGSEANIMPDFYRLDVTAGDRILLCTDGLYNEIGEEDIRALMESKTDLGELVGTLIKSACDNGGKDNITVNCVEI